MKLKNISLYIRITLLVFIVYLVAFMAVYFLNINRMVLQSEDAIPATYIPVSIILERNFDVNEYGQYFAHKYPNPDDKTRLAYYIRNINGHLLAAFPVAAAVLALPVYFLPVIILHPSADSIVIPFLGKLSAMLITAFSAGIFFLIAQEFLEKRKALFLSFIYAFATSTWSLAGQSLWQHGSALLFLLAAVYFLVKTEKSELSKNKFLFLTGLFFALSFWARPTNAISTGLFFLYVLIKYHQKIIYYILGIFLGLVPLFLYNFLVMGGLTKYSYKESDYLNLWTGRFPEGFLGLWFSPSKGILIYSPIIIFSLIGILLLFKRSNHVSQRLLFIFLTINIFIYTAVMGKWYQWYGGWSYSYRMAVDMVGFLVLLIIPVLLLNKKIFKNILFQALVLISVLIQLIGVAFYDGEWHALYDDGPINTKWLWSLENSELVYYSHKMYCRISTKNGTNYRQCLIGLTGKNL